MRHHPPSDAVPTPPHRPDPQPQPDSSAFWTFGLYLVIASLAMLFVGALWGYVYTRLNLGGMETNVPAATGQIILPPALWISTLMLLGVSACLHGAVRRAAAGDTARLRWRLRIAAVLAVAFVAVQTPSLKDLLDLHWRYMESRADATAQSTQMYGMVVVLIALHAAHVLGGLPSMFLVLKRCRQGRYTAQRHLGVRQLAIYWHFLDVVWIVMLGVLVLLG